MNKIISLCLFFVLVLLNSCKNGEEPTNSSKASDGSNVYLMNKGTWFKFKNSIGDVSGYTNTVIGEKIINGKTYAEIERLLDNAKIYIREEKNVVYILVYQYKGESYYTETKYVDFNNQNKNDSWTYERFFGNTIDRFKNYNLGNDYIYTLKGKEYTATKIQTDIYKVEDGKENKVATQYNWFIKGIGFVSMTTDNGSTELIDFGTN